MEPGVGGRPEALAVVEVIMPRPERDCCETMEAGGPDPGPCPGPGSPLDVGVNPGEGELDTSIEGLGRCPSWLVGVGGMGILDGA